MALKKSLFDYSIEKFTFLMSSKFKFKFSFLQNNKILDYNIIKSRKNNEDTKNLGL